MLGRRRPQAALIAGVELVLTQRQPFGRQIGAAVARVDRYAVPFIRVAISERGDTLILKRIGNIGADQIGHARL